MAFKYESTAKLELVLLAFVCYHRLVFHTTLYITLLLHPEQLVDAFPSTNRQVVETNRFKRPRNTAIVHRRPDIEIY